MLAVTKFKWLLLLKPGTGRDKRGISRACPVPFQVLVITDTDCLTPCCACARGVTPGSQTVNKYPVIIQWILGFGW